MGNVICVGLGGMVGSVCRYLLGLLPLQTGTGFPVKTWLINLLGAFVIGMAALYALSSMVLGVGAVLAGQWLLRG